MADRKIGTVYVELDLDPSRYTKGQQQLLKDAQNASSNLEQNFKNLGVKSDAVYDLMRAKAQRSFEAIANSAKATANDIIRAEQAKADQIRRIHDQQYAHQKTFIDKVKSDLQSVASSSLSTAALATAAFAAVSMGIKSTFDKGFKAVETYNESVASLAAMVLTFSERQKGQTLETQWKGALAYSTAMVPVLEQIAAKTLLSGQETTALANAFARSGVFLDGNNKKQIESFTRISNALPLMTQGQEIMRQINTEIRSLMNGTNEASSMMLTSLKAIDPALEANLKIWRAEGTVLENIGELLAGFGPATELLENQWKAVNSTLDTTVTQILREGMAGVYRDIIGLTKDLNKLLGDNKTEIASGIVVAWELVKNTTQAVSGILSGFSPVMKDLGKLTWEIAYGWGGIAAVSKPIGSAIGDTIEKMIIAAQLLVSYAKLGADVSLAIATGGLAGVDLVKAELANISKLQTQYDKIGTESTLDAIDKELAAYQKRVDAYRSGEKEKADLSILTISKQEKTLNDYYDIYAKREAESILQYVDNSAEREKAEKKGAKESEKALKEAQKAAEDYQKALADVVAESNKLTMSGTELKLVALDQWYAEYTEKLGGTIPALEEVYKNKRNLILLDEEEYAVGKKNAEGLIKSIEDLSAASRAAVEEEKKNALERSQAIRAMYQDMMSGGSADEELEYRTKLLDDQFERYKELKIDQNILDQWYYNELEKLEERMIAKKSEQAARGFADMEAAFLSIRGLYKEGTDAYNTMNEAAKAMAVAQKAVAVVTAVATIANQGLGDPYTAFARIAAMAAAMGALLGSIGASVGGGVGTSSQYAGTAASQGASGRLGAEIGVGSESILNSLAILQDTYDMEYTKLTNIYNEIRDLNRNITGLVTSIVRTGGVGVSVSTGSSMGAAQSIYNDLASYAFGGALVGDELANVLTLGVSSLVSSVVGAAFGGDTEKWVSALGITFGEATIQSLLDGIPVVAVQFAVVSTQTSGGWFGGSSFSQEWIYAELDAQVIDAINMIYKSMADTLIYIGEGLGADMQDVYNYVFKEQSTPDLLGMTTEEMNKALNEYFSSVMDTAVYDLFGEILLQYQKIDEALLETAIRLITDKEIILNMLELTGQGFSGTEEEAIALSEALIALAGDLQALTEAANIYYDKFTTEAQKQADLSNQLYDIMTEMNMALPSTREGYADLVAGLDLTNAENQEAYVTLMMLADAADAYYSAIEEAAKTVTDISTYYYDMMGVTTDLEKEIQSINEAFAEAIEAAILLGMSEEELAAIRAANADVVNKAIADSNAEYWAQVNQWMGTSSDLTATIEDMNEFFNAQYEATKALGASEEDLLYIREMQATAINHLIEDWESDVAAYYAEQMGYTTALQSSINAVNEYYEEQIKTAADLGYTTEQLTLMQQQQADVINKIIDDWAKALVQPLYELGISLYEWAQAINGMTTQQIALSTLLIYRAMEGFSATGPADVLNFTGMDENDLEAYSQELSKYYTTVSSALRNTYETLSRLKDTISQNQTDIATGQMTPGEQAIYYFEQAEAAYNSIFQLASEDIPDAVETARDNLMKYYALEKQVIKDKYDTEIAAIKEKNSIELQNIQAVRDKLLSLKYSSYNLALPTQKAIAGGADYNQMFAAAQTGDAASVSKYLSFVDTALGIAQDTYKSSATYQAFYAQVMQDIASLDTASAATIEELTNDQNALIEEQTAMMEAELSLLGDNVSAALDLLGSSIDDTMTSVMAELIGIFHAVAGLVAEVYGAQNQTSTMTTNSELQNAPMTVGDLNAYLYDTTGTYFMQDGLLTVSELLVTGFNVVFTEQAKLYTGMLAWYLADAAWQTRMETISVSHLAANQYEAQAIVAFQTWYQGAYYNALIAQYVANANLFGQMISALARIDFNTAQTSINTLNILLALNFGNNNDVKFQTWYMTTYYDALVAQYVANAGQFSQIIANTGRAYPVLDTSAIVAKEAEILASQNTGNANDTAFRTWTQGTFYNALIAWAGAELTELSKISYNTAQLTAALGMAGKYAEGAVVSSPTLGWIGEAGYSEAVIPMKNGYVPVRVSGGGYNDPEIKSLLKQIVVQGQQKQRVSLVLDNGQQLSGYIRAEADTVRVAANERKGVSRRRLYN